MNNVTDENLKAIDLFCGAGGISCGLNMTGIKVLAGVDIEKKYLHTFSHNFPESKSLNIDVSAYGPEDFQSLVSLDREELFLIVGGPPCQGFSKNVPRRERFLEDPRNLLVKSFLSQCENLRPQWVLLENVAEIRNGFGQAYTEEITARLSNAGYKVAYDVLNAADYGVPQRRKRAFFIANRIGVDFEFPQPTHQKSTCRDNPHSLPDHIGVWEAISDLPGLRHGEGETFCEYSHEPRTEFQKMMRGHNVLVSNHIARRLQPKQHSRLAALKPGQGLKDLPIHLQTKGGYSGAYGRLTKDMIAPTITRWVFHPGSGRWGHPVDTRTLSIREIARLQSFPDAYEFVGSFTAQAGQLGNAVPPLLVHQIVRQILRQTSSKRDNNAMNCSNFSFWEDLGVSKVMA